MNFKLLLSIVLLIAINVKGQQIDTKGDSYPKELIDFDYKRPVIKMDSSTLKNPSGLLRFSALTAYREGVGSTTGTGHFESVVDYQNRTSRLYMMNLSKVDMLSMGFVPQRDIILEVKDPKKYIYDSSQGSRLEWARKNTYCFEFMIPYGSGKIIERVRDQLSHYFGVTCATEKRLVDVLVLFRTSDKDKIKSAEKGDTYYDMKGYFNKVQLDRLGHPLNEAGMLPLVNETGYKGNVDLNLKIQSWKDIPALRKELQRYDLDIKQEKRELDKFIIREKK